MKSNNLKALNIYVLGEKLTYLMPFFHKIGCFNVTALQNENNLPDFTDVDVLITTREWASKISSTYYVIIVGEEDLWHANENNYEEADQMKAFMNALHHMAHLKAISQIIVQGR